MEAIALIALLLVVVVKGYTVHSIHTLEAKIRTTQAEEAEVSQRLHETESVFRQLDQESKTLQQETKHLENDRDLVCLEITKLGGTPITLEQYEAQFNQPAPAAKKNEPASQPSGTPPGSESQALNQNPENMDTEAAPARQQAGVASVSAPPDAQAHPEAPETPDLPSDSQKDGRSRILVVDDNSELRGLLHRALANEYNVVDAPDGFDALTKILKEKQIYDLIITDLKMPRLNGITLLEHLPDAIPVIVISGFVESPEFKNALSGLQPAAIIEKPFPMSALRNAIHTVLSPQTST